MRCPDPGQREEGMNRFMTVALGASMLSATGSVVAEDEQPPSMTAEQQAQMAAYQKSITPGAQHKQLEYFAGNWTAKTQVWMDPKGPAQESTGTSRGEVVYGGRFVVMTYTGTFWGQPFTGQATLGFDNTRGKFFNTWVDSMATGFWLAWGDYDKASNAWTFLGEMPDPLQPATTLKVRQVMRIYNDRHYGFDWYEIRGGKETRTMNIDYRRQ